MKTLRTVAREVWGLFVDDGSFAVAILLWLAAAWGLVRWTSPSARWHGPLLAAGLLGILAESAVRAAGRMRR